MGQSIKYFTLVKNDYGFYTVHKGADKYDYHFAPMSEVILVQVVKRRTC
jgi:hypothetical protein